MRTQTTKQKYLKYLENNEGKLKDFVYDVKKENLKEYKYWVIKENRFPYDEICELSHLLIPKRIVATYRELNTEELSDLQEIKEDIRSKYDCILESLSRGNPSISKHFHFHLFKWEEELFSRK